MNIEEEVLEDILVNPLPTVDTEEEEVEAEEEILEVDITTP